MEFVTVTYRTRRLAYIDGEKAGFTNRPLRVDAGTHVFTLGPRKNYRPNRRTVLVENTTVFDPRIVAFFKKETDD